MKQLLMNFGVLEISSSSLLDAQLLAKNVMVLLKMIAQNAKKIGPLKMVNVFPLQISSFWNNPS
jgi:hypothetical protein